MQPLSYSHEQAISLAYEIGGLLAQLASFQGKEYQQTHADQNAHLEKLRKGYIKLSLIKIVFIGKTDRNIFLRNLNDSSNIIISSDKVSRFTLKRESKKISIFR